MTVNPRIAFIKAAIWHGPLDEAEKLLASHPELASSDIHTAAITGNVEVVNRLLAEDPRNTIAVSEPYGGNALVYLCLSKYLRFHRERSDDFLRAATAMLDAGADPNSGFWTQGNYPEFETALYGAAGVAHHAALTKLLLARGADPNDVEAVYHSPETHENDALKALVETGMLSRESLSMMLIRKLDWHDPDGLKYLLEHGADPNGERKRGWHSLHHALARSNTLPMISLLLEYGANPLVVNGGRNAISRAAREGRKDVLTLFSEKGWAIDEWDGVDKLVAACTMGDDARIQTILRHSPALLDELMEMGGELLARFCLNGNEPAVRRVLDIGVHVNTPYETGDGYFGIPEGSLPIHVAAWLGWPSMVKLLIEKGSAVDRPDRNGHTPLALAVRACVDSYWTARRSPDSVKALLDAGASPKDTPFPSSYQEVDALLHAALKG